MTTGPAVNELPAVRNGFITFGCLNNYCKVTDKTVKLWAAAMTATGPTCKLLVLAPRGSAREDLLERLKRRRHRSDAHRVCRSRPARSLPKTLQPHRHRPRHVPLQRPHHLARRALDGRACANHRRANRGGARGVESALQHWPPRVGGSIRKAVDQNRRRARERSGQSFETADFAPRAIAAIAADECFEVRRADRGDLS